MPSHGLIKVIKAKNIKSLNSPQVKHNLSPINRTSVLGVDTYLWYGRGRGWRKFRHKDASNLVRKKKLPREWLYEINEP